MTKHTPGPWQATTERFDESRHLIGDIPAVAMNGACYALITSLGADRQETFANAALIAAAPDLLAALESIMSIIDAANAIDIHTRTDGRLAQQARAAIAKAKGE